MDETNVNAQDSSQNGDSSGGDGGSTSPETPTITKAEMDKAIEKARSDALAKAGRDAKALEAREKQIAEREKAHEEWQRRQEEAEEEAARGDAGKLADLQRKRKERDERKKLEDDRAAFEKEKSEHAEKLTRAEELEQEISVWKAAQKHGLDAEALKEKCAKFGFKTEQQISDFAAELAASGGNRGNLHIDTSEKRGAKDAGDGSPRSLIQEGLKERRK